MITPSPMALCLRKQLFFRCCLHPPWIGFLQRFSCMRSKRFCCDIGLATLRNQRCTVCGFLVIYLGLLYGLYVPDWQFEALSPASLLLNNGSLVYMVKCSTRGDLGPACNAAGMIDRYILGINHLYTKPVYRNLKECNISSNGQILENSPSWCHAPFDPEGILSSLPAAVTCLIGLQYGHILAQLQGHKERLNNWSVVSFLFLGIGFFLALVGIPLNKSLYSISYMLVTSASAGVTFSFLYVLVTKLMKKGIAQ